MSELDEFAEALMGQLSVEIDEEKVIAELAAKIKEDRNFTVEFDGVESVSQGLFPELVQKVNEYMGLEVSGKLSIEYLKLDEFKRLKGKKVFTENGRIFVDKLFDAVAKNDLKKISEWPKCVELSSNKLEPHRIPFYLYELVSLFHSYWNLGNDNKEFRFVPEGTKLNNSRLVLLQALSIVIKNGMSILGVSTPRSM